MFMIDYCLLCSYLDPEEEFILFDIYIYTISFSLTLFSISGER